MEIETMRSVLVLVILVAVLRTTESLTKFPENQEMTKDGCDATLCTTEYAPVCGSDGKTYSNTCKFCCGKGPGVTCACGGECKCTSQSPKCPKGANPCPSSSG